MPSPFEILAQGDQNTARLFASINAGLEATAQRQERSLNQAASLAINKESIIQNRQKLDLAERKFATDSFLDAARLQLSAAQSNAYLQQSARQLFNEDRKFKRDGLRERIVIGQMAMEAKALETGDFSGLSNFHQQALEEYESIDNTEIGDTSFMDSSMDRINKAGQAADFLLKGAGASVFGGRSDPNDSGVNAWGKKTGPGGVEGIAIPDHIFESLGITNEKDKENSKVLIRVNGKEMMINVADKGPRRDIWENGTADLTEGIIEQLDGTISRDARGRQTGASGIGEIDIIKVIPPGDQGTGNFGSAGNQLRSKDNLKYYSQSKAAAINEDPDSYAAAITKSGKKIPQTMEEMLKYERNVNSLSTIKPAQKEGAIAEMRRLSPAYDPVRKDILQTLAFSNDQDILLTDLDALQKHSQTYTDAGGNIVEYSQLKELVMQRNKLDGAIFTSSANRRNAIASTFRSASIPSDDPSSFFDPSGFADEADFEMKKIAKFQGQLKIVQDKIDKIAGIEPLPEPEAPEAGNPEIATGRFLNGGNEAAKAEARKAQDDLFSSRSLSENLSDLREQELPGFINIKSAIKEVSPDIDPSTVSITSIGQESLSKLKSEIKGSSKLGTKPLGRGTILDTAVDTLINKFIQDDSDTITVEELNKSGKDLTAQVNSLINSASTEDLEMMGKILVDRGLIEESPDNISFGAGASIGPVNPRYLEKSALDYMTNLKDRSTFETISMIPILKTAKVLVKLAG